MLTLRTSRLRALLNALALSTYPAAIETRLVSAMHEQIDAIDAAVKRAAFEAQKKAPTDADRASAEEAQGWPDVGSLLKAEPEPARHDDDAAIAPAPVVRRDD